MEAQNQIQPTKSNKTAGKGLKFWISIGCISLVGIVVMLLGMVYVFYLFFPMPEEALAPAKSIQADEKAKETQAVEFQKESEEDAARKAEEEQRKREEEVKNKAEEEQTTPTPIPTQSEPNEESQPKSYSTTIEDFPKKLEKYLNGTWDEMPGTRYKVYWWDEWEGVDSGNTHLVVEPSFEPTKQQCQRIAQVATISRVYWVGKKEGVIHVTEYDNSGDYCKLKTP